MSVTKEPDASERFTFGILATAGLKSAQVDHGLNVPAVCAAAEPFQMRAQRETNILWLFLIRSVFIFSRWKATINNTEHPSNTNMAKPTSYSYLQAVTNF